VEPNKRKELSSMSSTPFSIAFTQRVDQLGLSSLREIANYINSHAHAAAGEPATITRYTVHDWRSGRHTPAAAYRPMVSRALCIPRRAMVLLCAGMQCELPAMPGEDDMLGGDHAE